MSEKDLGLKVQSRRLLWRMGFTTRVDVPLRALVPRNGGAQRRAQPETFTDLDVLGLVVVPGYSLRSLIVDCKTTQRRSTERMFWIRGVGEFFNASEAWMVRTGGVSAAARQLAGRLDISVLEPTDLAKLEEIHPGELDIDSGPLTLLFDESRVAASMRQLTSLDKKLDPLIEYRQFDYWVYDNHRNLQQVVAHLTNARAVLDPAIPEHRAVFLDCAWLYGLALAHAIANIRSVHVSNPDQALQQYLFGGQVGLQEKQSLAKLLAKFAPGNIDTTSFDGALPSYYSLLLELMQRHFRRPAVTTDELRYAEWAAEAQLAREPSTIADVFGAAFNPVAAKLLADICGFLVTTAKLDQGFREFARLVFAQPEPMDDHAGHGNRQPTLDMPEMRR